MDKSFPISDFPFSRSGFLYKMHEARSKYQDSKNKIIDYGQFHYRIDYEVIASNHTCTGIYPSLKARQNFIISSRTVRAFFDILHFISLEKMEFYKAIELTVFIGHEGQIEMNSKLEMRLLSRLVEYIKESNLSRLEHALTFIYLTCWGPNAKEGFGVIELLIQNL